MGKYIDGSGLSHFMGIIKGAFVSNVSYDTVNKLLVKTKGGTDHVVAPLSAAGASGSYNDLSDKPTIPSANTTATNIKMDGTQSAGSLATFAKADHVHPSDTSRVPTTRKVNGKALSSDVTLYAGDIDISASNASSIAETITNLSDGITGALSAQIFDGVKLADTGAVARFATCSTAASTAAKTITLTSPVTLTTGLIVFVKFTTTNTAAVGSLTLAITSPTSATDSTATTTTAKPIKYRGANLSSAGRLAANRVYAFVYDGTNFELVGDLDTTYSEATTSAAGLMSSSDKTKLNGIATGAEVNQNAFSNVKVGSTTVEADGKTDTLELVAGSNVTLTPDATNDKVTIAASVPSANSTATNIKMDGTQSAGSLTTFAKADHVHPSDTSRVPTTRKVNGKALSADVTLKGSDIVVDEDESSGMTITEWVEYFYDRADFQFVKVGTTTITPNSNSGVLELAGSNVTLTPDDANDKVTIGITASNVTTALGNTAVARATGDASGNAIASTYAKLAAPALTGTPTAPTAAAGTNSTQIATTAFVANAVGTATAGALQYKGTVDAESTITGAAYKKGWYYVVSTAGTYVGKVCEVGDMLIAKQDKTSTPANDWDAVQSNIEVLSNSEIDALWTAA